MHKKSAFEQPDDQFIAHVNTVLSQCTAHSTEWKLPEDRLTSLNRLVTNATTAYTANKDKATHNLITSANKKAAFSDLKHFLSLFVDFLEGNLSVPDEALAIMGLRPRVHHVSEPMPRPTEAPVIRVIKQHGEMAVYVSRAERGQPTQTATQKHYYGFKIRWRFEGEKQDHTDVSTRLHYTLHFDREDETKRIIIAVAWINPRLEEGPWTEDISEVVG
jgi:hypothetical protein